MTLEDAFDDFLIRKVNLSETQLIRLNDRVDAVTGYLREKWAYASYIDDFVPQGSLAQKTIIRPLNKPVFDADLLMMMHPVPGWTAATYTRELKEAFRASGTYGKMAHKRTRCVYIDYANEFHIDVVPYVISQLSITNNKNDSYEYSRPEEFNTWLDGKDRAAGGHLPEVIRLLKFLRDKRGLGTKSLFLTVLVGDRINTWDPDSGYGDTPTAFATIVAKLAEYLEATPTMPYLADPAGTACNLADRWTPEGYTALRNWVTLSLAPNVAAASAETDLILAEILWQEVFGTDFKIVSTALVTKSSASLIAQTEQWLHRDFSIPIRLSETVSMVGRVRMFGVANKAYDLPTRGNRVGKDRGIDFEVRSCSVREPFDVYWKIRNKGSEASERGQLRGEIHRAPAGAMTRAEHTAYRGSHFVEVYVVRDGVCVAKDHQQVVVTR